MSVNASQINRAFAVGVRAERVDKGLSQKVLAASIARHPAAIAMIEAGSRGVSVGESYALAQALGTVPAQLVRKGLRLLRGDAE